METIDTATIMKDALDNEEFHELCQTYRKFQ